MFADCFFKKRILPCCDIMDFFLNIQDGVWLVSLSPFPLNISETKDAIKNLTRSII